MPMRLTTTLLLVMLAAGCCRVAVGAPATVELRERVLVEGEEITLGQLAEITPEERAEELGAVKIGPAPLPGDGRRLTAGYLKMRLRHGGVACDEIAFTGAECVEVWRAPTLTGTSPAEHGEVEATGQPGARHLIPEPVIVRRGTRVRLTVLCGAVVIGAEATLLEDGTVGGLVKMRVEQTRETVVAQIVQPTDARVYAR